MSRHSPRARAALLAAAVLALLAGCKEPPGSSLFPLEEGRRWTYRLSSEWENDTRERETVVLSNLGRDSALESGSAWHRRSDTGLDYWLRADATGIYRALKRMEEAELVTSVWDTPEEGSAKRLFSLTDKGWQASAPWTCAASPPTTVSGPPRSMRSGPGCGPGCCWS